MFLNLYILQKPQERNQDFLQGGVQLQARIQKFGLGGGMGQCADRKLAPMRAVGWCGAP
jgi:hypothetical protein